MEVTIKFDPEKDKDVRKLYDLSSFLRDLRIEPCLSASAPVEQTPPAPVEQTPPAPVEQTPPAPVEQAPPADPGKVWTPELINEEILVPLKDRIGEAAFMKEAVQKRFQPILQEEFQSSGLGNVAPEKLGDVAKRLNEIIARDFPEGYTYGA